MQVFFYQNILSTIYKVPDNCLSFYFVNSTSNVLLKACMFECENRNHVQYFSAFMTDEDNA